MTGSVDASRTVSVEAPRRAHFGHAVAAEWTKLWSVPSTLWILVVTAVVIVGVAVLSARSMVDFAPAATYSPAEVVDIALQGAVFGQLAICALAALTITGEYGTGAIRVTLVAVPVRGRLLAAKLTGVGAVALASGLITGPVSFLVARAALGASADTARLTDQDVFRAVAGLGPYLAVLAGFSFAVGMLLRNSALTISVLAVSVLVVPLVSTQAGSWGQAVVKWWPPRAGIQLTRVDAVSGYLSPLVGFTVFSVVTMALLAVAHLVFRRRNA
jgi:ABC-2 type transport system permease protein